MSITASQARSAALERLLVKREATAGTAEIPDTRLSAFKVGDWKQEGNVDAYGESGSLFYTQTVLGHEWASNEFNGAMSFSQDQFMLDSALGEHEPTTVGTNGRLREYSIDPFGAYDPVTYSMASGQAVRAERYPYGFFSGFKYVISSMKAEKSGGLLARAVEDNVALIDPEDIVGMAYEPMVPNKFYMKTASSFAGLAGASPLVEAFDMSFEYSALFGLAFPMVANQISFSFPVQLFPNSLFTINLMKRAIGMGFLNQLRNATVAYFECGIIGSLIETGINRFWKLQVAGNFSKPFDPTTIDPGIKGVQWSFYPCPQADMPNGHAFNISLQNNVP